MRLRNLTAVATLAAALLAGAGAAPAVAATPAQAPAPTITGLGCESGAGVIACWLSYSSTEPVQIRWRLNEIPMPQWDNSTYAASGCGEGDIMWVTVSNSGGADVEGSSPQGCNTGPWW